LALATTCAWAQRPEAQINQALQYNYQYDSAVRAKLALLEAQGAEIIKKAGPPATGSSTSGPASPASCEGVMIMGVCSAAGGVRR
jgi:hypothetical protein